ncbi:phosphoenolpyruvate hydrolase family protein [Nonomuraea rhizosphaerae]|uniref:phosphoenolpyruvate hydrolase family protein n=1 Tax=Nonomuraea rhizosphaerae TaxID=2665663 RepID=UPI001C5EA46C|nr:phosphoenolpyruvate hydrolase family protein [Nonomuraea rhizosphaerae]
MNRRIAREEILRRLREEITAGRQIVATGAGSGLVARVADRSAVDLIVVYSSGKFRQDGLASIVGALPVANANEVMLELGRERIFPVVRDTPVIGGIYTHDPTRDLDDLLDQMITTGYSGVINFPTVGRIDGSYRADLESLGFGFAQEVEMLRRAAARDLLTLAYVYTPHEAAQVVEAGVDVVVAHGGVTGGGDIGLARTRTLDATAETFTGIFDAARAARDDVVVLTHGGPIITPEDAAEIAARTGAHGFVGASSTERIPIENALKTVYAAFKAGPGA